MKKSIIYLLVAVLAAFMAMPQEAMAKKYYLGHLYKGEMKKKIPNGQGIMNVGGLLIEGIFDGQSVTNAKVEVVRMKSEDPKNCMFRGTITYDESDNIVLKAGGVFAVDYLVEPEIGFRNESYEELEEMAETIEETLKEDRIVNYNSFEKKVLHIPYYFTPSKFGLKSEIPTIIETSVALSLKDLSYSNGGYTQHYSFFVFDKGKQKLSEESLTGYKDEKGRIWNFYSKQPLRYRVDYPNGDWIAYNSRQDENWSWRINFPDGTFLSKENNKQLAFFNNLFAIGGLDKSGETFIKYRGMDKFMYTFSKDEIDLFLTDEPKEGMEKFIPERVLPYLKNETNQNFKCTIRKGYSWYDQALLGYYENGKYTSYDEIKQAAHEQEQKQEQEAYEKACKKYGKKYVDAFEAGEVIVGMPEELLKHFVHKVTYQSGSNKTYAILGGWTNTDRIFTVYVTNGKVTSFRDHR